MRLDLNRFFDAASLARGVSYAKAGRVVRLSVLAPDGQLTAQVRGSGREPYEVALRLTFGGDLRLLRVTGICSCPVGVLCKHIVAALIVWQIRVAQGETPLPEPREDPPAPVAPVLPYPVVEWLAALAAPTPEAAGAASEYAPAVRDRLVYVFGLNGINPQVTVMKALTQKDGWISERATRYDVERLKRQTDRPQFILRTDLEILRDLEAAGVAANSGSSSGYHWEPKFLEDGPPDLLPILRRIAATGRGRWAERNGPFLHEEPPRAAEFRWQGEDGGAQELRLICSETAVPLVALPLATPAWLDPATGAFGVLETRLDPARMRALMRAPKIPAEIAAEVAARLSGMAGQFIPAPQAIGIETRQGRAPVPVLRLFGLRGQRHVGEAWRRKK